MISREREAEDTRVSLHNSFGQHIFIILLILTVF